MQGANAALVNKGLISADLAGYQLQVGVDSFTNQGTAEARNGAFLLITGAWHNTGTLRADAGTLDLGGAVAAADIGNVSVLNGGQVRIAGDLNNLNATLSPAKAPPGFAAISPTTASSAAFGEDLGSPATSAITPEPCCISVMAIAFSALGRCPFRSAGRRSQTRP